MITLLFKAIWWALFGGCWHEWSQWSGVDMNEKQRRSCVKCKETRQRDIIPLRIEL